MRSTRLAVALIMIGALSMPIPAASAAPFHCIGAPLDEPNGGFYPEQRQFVESQSWWRPGPGQAVTAASDNGHAHLGACIPERETLSSGNVDFSVRLILHDNPGVMTQTSLVFKGNDYETTVNTATYSSFRCTVPGNCTKWVSLTAPVASFNHSGLQEIRIRGGAKELSVNGSGREMKISLNWQVNIQNGKSVSNVSRFPWLRGKGWYSHALYCESAFLSQPIPDSAVSGTWSPQVHQLTHSSDASLPVTYHSVRLDPDFHAIPPVPGTILSDGAGQLLDTTFAIDTTVLSNGVHKLFQRADCRDDSLTSTNSGVLVIPFEVRN
jgi:hypothetical protein